MTTIHFVKITADGYDAWSIPAASVDAREEAEQWVNDGDADEASIGWATYTVEDGWDDEEQGAA